MVGMVLIIYFWAGTPINRDFAGSTSPAPTSTWDITSREWWNHVYSDGKYVVSSPLRWEKEDEWNKCAFIIGTAGGIMFQDERIQDWVQERRTSGWNTISSKITSQFGAEYAIIGLGSLYLTGCLIRDTKLKRVALLGTESAAINGIIVGVLKVLMGRSRPYEEKGAWNYYLFNIKAIGEGNQSLPSGHTSTAFAITSCLADECKNLWVTTIGYTTATLVGISRIYDNKHWTSDVFLGGVIGISIGKAVAKLNK